MELRVLKYFLTAAQEENITKAAALLHITQPTLSRQLAQLEEELGVSLFCRSSHSIVLTEEGLLLKRRAQELISLSEKTVRELSNRDGMLAGEITVGCGETRSMAFLAEQFRSFQQEYPLVQFRVQSAGEDEIREGLEKGMFDVGLLTEPVDSGKYEFIRMPYRDQWGILTRRDSELAARNYICPKDLLGTPLVLVKRERLKKDLASWFGDSYGQLQISATCNLILNAAAMVKGGMGAALCFDLGANYYEDLYFVPLAPALETGAALVWKKNQIFGEAAFQFIEFTRNIL